MFHNLLVPVAFAAASLTGPTGSVLAKPTGKWVVEFADQHCMASHRFTIGKSEFAVGLQPQPTTQFYSLWLTVPSGGPSLSDAQAAIAGMGIDRAGMSIQGVDNNGRTAYAVRLTEAEFTRLVASGDVVVVAGKWSSTFHLARLADIRRTLNSCIRDLLSSWGMSAEAQAELASFPVPERESYVTADDYPTGALNRGASGTVEVRITVDADGKGQKCDVLVSSGDADLDATTCAIYVQRARYQPARTKQGVAVEGLYVVRVAWRMS